jgi:uncharacterized protein YjbI with pentapeptide repeats
MTDAAAAPALDSETPLNPYSLLEAVHRAARSASLAWLGLLGLMAYILLVLAGIGHRDLLLDADITLPILQAKVTLTRFFIWAPILFVLLHLAVIGQLALVARKTLAFAGAIRLLEASEARTHPLRHELDTFFLVQAIAGPERSRVIGTLLHGLGWVSLVILPVLLLLYLQAAFLPYHAVPITMVHRFALLADLSGLILVGIFLLRSETSFLWALLRTGRQHAFGLLFAVASFVGAAVCSLFIATVPGEQLDRADLFAAARQHTVDVSLLGQALPAFGAVFGAQAAFLPRNLIVTDLDLAAANAAVAGRASINLRGRDLRFARFDRSQLRGADLSGANLDGASFTDADLSNSALACLTQDSDQTGADRSHAQCVRARKANLARAKLSAATLSGIDLTEANLAAARLEDAQLEGAVLASANLSGARLERTNLAGGVLRGAKLSGASLQGADLSGAQLQLANLSQVKAQGVDLSTANLEGAVLHNAELEGANLSRSRLHAADLAGAKLGGADLVAAMIWQTVPPSQDGLTLADTAEIILRPPHDQDSPQLGANARSDTATLAVRLGEDPARSGSASELRAWGTSAEQQVWQSLAKPREASDADEYKSRLTGYLIRLMCQSRWANGAVAAGVAKRAMARGFKGDLEAIHARLKSATDCSASHKISPRLMQALDAAAELSAAQD